MDWKNPFGADTTTPAPAPAPGDDTVDRTDGQPQEPEVVAPATSTAELPADDFSDWIAWVDADGWRRTSRPDCGPETYIRFDALPEPDWNCPRCGGLLWWEDLRGGRHCARCEARTLTHSVELAEKAARLRQIAQPAAETAPSKKRASPAAPRCEERHSPDALLVNNKRPSDAIPGRSEGYESGHSPVANCGEN